MNFCNSVHLGKFVLSRAKLKINCLTVSQAAKKKGSCRLQKDKVYMPAGLINHIVFYIFTAGFVQGMITLLFFEPLIETL